MEVFKENLYHGSDLYIQSMTSEERQNMKEKCFTVLELLVSLYKENGYANEVFRSDIKGLMDLKSVFLQAKAVLNHNKFYEYDSFYFTREIKRAAYYARIAFHYGELGYFAWALLKGIELVGYKLPTSLTQEQQHAIDAVYEFGNHNPEPVIYKFKNIPIEKLLDESGYKRIISSNVRYLGIPDFSNAIEYTGELLVCKLKAVGFTGFQFTIF